MPLVAIEIRYRLQYYRTRKRNAIRTKRLPFIEIRIALWIFLVSHEFERVRRER